jgi:hypothetical protein
VVACSFEMLLREAGLENTHKNDVAELSEGEVTRREECEMAIIARCCARNKVCA